MKNKGFTLIELLAVIVVLGIIMLIAITSVSGVIEKSRNDAFTKTAMAYADAAKKKIYSESLSLPKFGESKTIYFDKGMVEKGGITSPYGRDFTVLDNSLVNQTTIDGLNDSLATAVSNVVITCETKDANDNCIYSYYVYLSDGVNGIGCYNDTNKIGQGVLEQNLSSYDIIPIIVCNP